MPLSAGQEHPSPFNGSSPLAWLLMQRRLFRNVAPSAPASVCAALGPRGTRGTRKRRLACSLQDISSDPASRPTPSNVQYSSCTSVCWQLCVGTIPSRIPGSQPRAAGACRALLGRRECTSCAYALLSASWRVRALLARRPPRERRKELDREVGFFGKGAWPASQPRAGDGAADLAGGALAAFHPTWQAVYGWTCCRLTSGPALGRESIRGVCVTCNRPAQPAARTCMAPRRWGAHTPPADWPTRFRVSHCAKRFLCMRVHGRQWLAPAWDV